MTDDTDVTVSEERVDTLIDGIATANRAAIAIRAELASLRYTIVFALIMGGVLFIELQRRSQ